jgi:RNA polymerase sigma-70 factor (ECF subfamily)
VGFFCTAPVANLYSASPPLSPFRTAGPVRFPAVFALVRPACRWRSHELPGRSLSCKAIAEARDWRDGDRAALERLLPLVYGELHRMAAHYMHGERRGHTLQTSALVNEAYLRLADYRQMRWQDRAHFFAVAAQAMRRILVDHARRRGNQKRGGDVRKVSLDEALIVSDDRAAEVVALDDALARLAEIAPRKSQLVELRFFGGLGIEETAEVLQVSPGTVMRDWTLAKAWLRREMTGGE